MKSNRTKNAARNILYGTVLKVYQIIMPFILRTVMIYTIGVQYLGLNSLFTSVLQVLNLAELGVGSAMVFSMYRPIADGNVEKINSLLQLYKTYYRVIGTFILVAGGICTPFIPHLIHGKIPADMNVYILYLLNLGVTVLTYWLYAYMNSILQAYQRRDIISKVSLFTYTFKYILQFCSLLVFKSYYLYVICRLITQIMTNIITAVASKKMYPMHRAFGKLPVEERKIINRRIRDLFTSKLGGTIVSSADTIVISAFLGLEMLAIYQNYYYILSSIMAFITIINSSVLAGVGNSLITKTAEENYYDFRVFSFLQFWIIGFCVCCFSALFQPFMELWMGKELMFPYSVVALLCFLFACNEIILILSVYKDAGGIWHEDRYRPLLAGICNLTLNLVMVRFIGIYGIVLSTILSVLIVSLPWLLNNLFKHLFVGQNKKLYLLDMLYWLLIIVMACVLTNGICVFVTDSGIFGIIVRLFLCTIVPNSLFFLVFRKKDEFKSSIGIVKRIANIK